MDNIKQFIFDLTYLLDNVYDEICNLYYVEKDYIDETEDLYITSYGYRYNLDDDIPYNINDINLFWHFLAFTHLFIYKFYNEDIITSEDIVYKYMNYENMNENLKLITKKNILVGGLRSIYFDDMKKELIVINEKMKNYYKNKTKDK